MATSQRRKARGNGTNLPGDDLRSCEAPGYYWGYLRPLRASKPRTSEATSASIAWTSDTADSCGLTCVAVCIALLTHAYYNIAMKTLTVRLPEPLASEIEAESRGRGISKSDVIRERLQNASGHARKHSPTLDAVADLIGSVDGLPPDLSARTKQYLAATGYGSKRPR